MKTILSGNSKSVLYQLLDKPSSEDISEDLKARKNDHWQTRRLQRKKTVDSIDDIDIKNIKQIIYIR